MPSSHWLKNFQCSVLVFSDLLNYVSQNPRVWKDFLESSDPTSCVPRWWDDLRSSSPLESSIRDLFSELLVVKAFRPDRMLDAAHKFVQLVLGEDYHHGSDLDLEAIVQSEIGHATPIALVSAPGYDASFRVDQLVERHGVHCTSVAMGSSEGVALAERAISSSLQSGSWVLLKNVHLATAWLSQLEKRLQSLRAHPEFRLFLTMEASLKIPVNLLRQSRVLMFEAPPGIKASMLQTFKSISPQRFDQGPIERVRIYFLISWLHAVLQERSRYLPLGWTKSYDVNDSDQASALDVVDAWIDLAAQGRSHLSPEKVPWQALRTIILESVYGGRIDNEFDYAVLESFISRLISPDAYDLGFALIRGEDFPDVTIPDVTKVNHFLEWIDTLPEREPPTWLGLPKNAEKVILTRKGEKLLSKVLKVKGLQDDQDSSLSRATSSDVIKMEEDYAHTDHSAGHDDSAMKGVDDKRVSRTLPVWMETLSKQLFKWLSLIPESLASVDEDKCQLPQPLVRFFSREVWMTNQLLRVIRSDLVKLCEFFTGRTKSTNHVRDLAAVLSKGDIPARWIKYRIPAELQISRFIEDFAERVRRLSQMKDQLDALAMGAGGLTGPDMTIWFGSLFMPEAFLTASRQAYAQVNGWSLEQVRLHVDLDQNDMNVDPVGGSMIKLAGMRLEGAAVSSGRLVVTSDLQVALPSVSLRWIRVSPTDPTPGLQDIDTTVNSDKDECEIPVYLNGDRKDLMFSVGLASVTLEERVMFAQRGVALVAAF